jgi:hypothetical protein
MPATQLPHPRSKTVRFTLPATFLTIVCAHAALCADAPTTKPATTAPATTRRAVANLRSMKGWNLHAWRDDAGDTYVALVQGTNSIKSEDEISRKAVKGVDAARDKLRDLQPGQEVLIVGLKRSEKAPKDVADDLEQTCESLGLKVRQR